ncbi:SUN domain-containing protein 3 [Alexandromys fortis]|uniref:SUN domain-containing protein 3 n=1 Tax=Alexandromys fortis TaxID=100897 RepID=UPI0021536AB4|nr:SUN domain-containing protein 3 [Microtus fortis]
MPAVIREEMRVKTSGTEDSMFATKAKVGKVISGSSAGATVSNPATGQKESFILQYPSSGQDSADEVNLSALRHSPDFQLMESSWELADERLRATLWSDLTYWDRLTLSWKIILSTMFTSTFLLFGLQNHPRFKEKRVSQKPKQISSIIEEYGTRLYNYQARLRLPKEQLELLKKESQTLENNFREILLLTEQIDVLKALLRDMKDGIHNHSWPAHQEAVQNQGTTEVLDEEVSNLVHYVLKKFRGDQIQMADYALKSAGASVIEAGTSESYKNNKAKLYWHGIGFLNYEMPPDMILQPDVHPGKCWAFPGSQGHILIKLARKIIPTAVTMEHISEKVSPSGNTSSAPKDFSVYGMMKRCEGEEMFLGQFMYNKAETTVQTFKLQNEASESLLCVKLQILSNWGHPKYTCLYRFRVHGIPSDHT